MIRLFCGLEHREAVGYYVCLDSINKYSRDVWTQPIYGIQKNSTNRFTHARFRVPELCNYAGFAIFIDCSDMLLRADIGELWALRDPSKAVQVVKHDYISRAERKYIGTPLESGNKSYPRKNWSSVVIWNSGHVAHWHNRAKIAKAIEEGHGQFLHRFQWLRDEEIGELPSVWNHLVGEQEPDKGAKLAHFTLGIPGFDHYWDSEFGTEWKAALIRVLGGCQLTCN